MRAGVVGLPCKGPRGHRRTVKSVRTTAERRCVSVPADHRSAGPKRDRGVDGSERTENDRSVRPAAKARQGLACAGEPDLGFRGLGARELKGRTAWARSTALKASPAEEVLGRESRVVLS